jgi:hypothetical protein
VDRHRFDDYPDPNFHVDAVPDPNQNDADPYADPTPKFYTCWGKSKYFLKVLITALPIY